MCCDHKQAQVWLQPTLRTWGLPSTKRWTWTTHSARELFSTSLNVLLRPTNSMNNTEHFVNLYDVLGFTTNPATCLGEQVQGEHLPFAHCSVQGHPSSALHCWHWWRCGLHQSGCYLHQSHCGPLSGLSFGGCFILPNLFFSRWARWVYGLAGKGSLLAKEKWAHSWALLSWLGSWCCVFPNYTCAFLGVIRTSQSASLYFRSGGSGRVDRSWAGHALLFVCLYVSFHVFCFSLIRAVASLLCSCLAVFLVTLLLALCEYNFYLLESPKRV